MAVSGRVRGHRDPGVGIERTFWRLPYSAGYLAFVVVDTYSSFNIKFVNKKDASFKHCPLSENGFLDSNYLEVLFGGRETPLVPPLWGFHFSHQE